MHLENLPGKRLSKRELEVLRLIACGYSADDIAVELGLVSDTIKQYRYHMVKKLKAKSSAHAVSLAFRKGILRWNK